MSILRFVLGLNSICAKEIIWAALIGSLFSPHWCIFLLCSDLQLLLVWSKQQLLSSSNCHCLLLIGAGKCSDWASLHLSRAGPWRTVSASDIPPLTGEASLLRDPLPLLALHVGMSKVMSRGSLCVWIDWCVCHVGMLRAVCLLGTWKLVTLRFSCRAYPWKEPEWPPFSVLLTNSLTLILPSCSPLPSTWTHAVTFAQMWGGRAPTL